MTTTTTTNTNTANIMSKIIVIKISDEFENTQINWQSPVEIKLVQEKLNQKFKINSKIEFFATGNSAVVIENIDDELKGSATLQNEIISTLTKLRPLKKIFVLGLANSAMKYHITQIKEEIQKNSALAEARYAEALLGYIDTNNPPKPADTAKRNLMFMSVIAVQKAIQTYIYTYKNKYAEFTAFQHYNKLMDSDGFFTTVVEICLKSISNDYAVAEYVLCNYLKPNFSWSDSNIKNFQSWVKKISRYEYRDLFIGEPTEVLFMDGFNSSLEIYWEDSEDVNE